MTVILDTCALIWWSLDPDKLSDQAKLACDEMEIEKNGLVASISLWEIALKIKNKKLDSEKNDSDDLLSEYNFDYSKAQKNRFAPSNKKQLINNH